MEEEEVNRYGGGWIVVQNSCLHSYWSSASEARMVTTIFALIGAGGGAILGGFVGFFSGTIVEGVCLSAMVMGVILPTMSIIVGAWVNPGFRRQLTVRLRGCLRKIRLRSCRSKFCSANEQPQAQSQSTTITGRCSGGFGQTR